MDWVSRTGVQKGLPSIFETDENDWKLTFTIGVEHVAEVDYLRSR